MVYSSITVSLVPEVHGGPFIFWDDLAAACKKASSLGFHAVEIFPPAAGALDALEVRKLLTDHNLMLAAMGTGAGWVKHRLHLCLPDAGARARARDFIRSIIDLAGSLGAPAIIGSMQGRTDDDSLHDAALGYLLEALYDLGEHADHYEVPLLFEPLNRYETNLVNTLEAGVRLLESLPNSNVALLADLFHMNIEEVNLADALRGARGHLGHVHFVDSNRRPAGLGHLDYPPIVAALRDIGYGGFASAEALPYPDPDAAAAQAMAAFRRYFGEERC